jgi:DMSO reductase anchor subunit
MTLAWLAGQLHLGSPSRIACLLYRYEKNGSSKEICENTLF